MKTKIIILIIGIVISFAFVSCEKDKDKKQPTTTQTSTTYSVRYNVVSEQADNYIAHVLTYSTILQCTRNDTYYIGDLHSIELTDHKNQTKRTYDYSGIWYDSQYSSLTYDALWKYYSNMPVSSTREIAGKKCNVYVVQGEFATEIAFWNKILMYISNASLQMEATAVTFDVPENAFSEETINVDWI